MPSARTKWAKNKQYYQTNADKLCSQFKEYHRLHANEIKKGNTKLMLRTKGQLHVLTQKSNTALTQTKRSLLHVHTRKSNTKLILVLKRPAHVHTVQKTEIVYVLIDVTGMH